MYRTILRAAALLFCFALPFVSNAQCLLYEVSLEERSQKASLITEARILDQNTFRHSDNLIYTASRIKVTAVLKGELPANELYLITPGGQIGDQMIRVEPSLETSIGHSGILFLQPSKVKSMELSENTQFEAYSSVQGFIYFDPLSERASDPFHVYQDRAEIRSKIARLTGVSPLILEKEAVKVSEATGNKAMMAPLIPSFTPGAANAGTSTVLTILGSNFEAYDGGTNSTVFFANADDGGATFTAAPASEVQSWTATQITVNVPSGAGTGTFIVRNSSGLTGNSPSGLTVPFNHTNVTSSATRFPTHLTNDNGSGGYTLALSTSTASSGVNFSTSAGLAPFSRALDTWVCTTGFNTVISGTTASTVVDPNDATNIVMFDNAASPLPAGVLGRATSGYGSCTGTSWFVNGFDIQFRRDGTGGVTWNFGAAATALCCFDFESVAVHELGHAHQLGHIIAPGNVMHFGLANGSDTRTLNATSDIAGGNFVMAQSNGYTACFGSVSGMTPSVCVPLDLQFQYISGSLISPSEAEINWQTDLSSPVISFQILRSEDGIDWANIGEASVNPDKTEANRFSWTDPAFKGNKQLYQVQALLSNGETVNSEVVEVLSASAGWTTKVWPNPFVNMLNVESLGSNAPLDIEIFSMDGRKVYASIGNEGNNLLNANEIGSFPAGLYILRLSSGQQQRHFRLVKE